MATAGARGSALDAHVEVVNNDVPTDPVELREKRLAQADAAIAAAEAKVEKQKHFVDTAPHGKKERARAHLAGAQKGLAEAISARKKLADKAAE